MSSIFDIPKELLSDDVPYKEELKLAVDLALKGKSP